MNVIISNADGRPIYEQIYQQIKGAIMKGELKDGDALPSIRALAKDLRISVITTKRAFDDLEKDGFIRSVQGKGSFVAPADPELLKEEQLKRLESRLAAAAEIAEELGMDDEEVFSLYKLLKEE